MWSVVFHVSIMSKKISTGSLVSMLTGIQLRRIVAQQAQCPLDTNTARLSAFLPLFPSSVTPLLILLPLLSPESLTYCLLHSHDFLKGFDCFLVCSQIVVLLTCGDADKHKAPSQTALKFLTNQKWNVSRLCSLGGSWGELDKSKTIPSCKVALEQVASPHPAVPWYTVQSLSALINIYRLHFQHKLHFTLVLSTLTQGEA